MEDKQEGVTAETDRRWMRTTKRGPLLHGIKMCPKLYRIQMKVRKNKPRCNRRSHQPRWCIMNHQFKQVKEGNNTEIC